MNYINWKYNNEIETIDECKTRKEASTLRDEYIMAYGVGIVYISQRSTKAWRDR